MARLRIGGYEVFDHSYDAVVIGAGGAGGRGAGRAGGWTKEDVYICFQGYLELIWSVPMEDPLLDKFHIHFWRLHLFLVLFFGCVEKKYWRCMQKRLNMVILTLIILG